MKGLPERRMTQVQVRTTVRRMKKEKSEVRKEMTTRITLRASVASDE